MSGGSGRESDEEASSLGFWTWRWSSYEVLLETGSETAYFAPYFVRAENSSFLRQEERKPAVRELCTFCFLYAYIFCC
jgi:hypothetical protein